MIPNTITTETRISIEKIVRISLLTTILYFFFFQQVFALPVHAPDPSIAKDLGVTEDNRASKIASYFATHDLPLAENAQDFIDAADKYGIDWKLLPAIGFIESTGGKHACANVTYSPFGWGSCTIDFDSYEQAIDIVSMNLGGYNPNTSHFYKEKSQSEVLYAYNSVISNYEAKIVKEMIRIENQ